MSQQQRSRTTVLASLLLALGLVSGCRATTAETTTAIKVAPALSSVTALADPRSYSGPSTAVLASDDVSPIATNVKPALPVTVTDAQGTSLTVTSAARILALDIYGTLGRTVFDLGLGSHVVGRDRSTQFPAAQKLPLVTTNGHDLNAEAILALHPTVLVTDTTLGPWSAVEQVRAAGVPVIVTDSTRSLADVATITQEVANALGVPAAGRALAAQQTRQIAAVKAEIARVSPTADDSKLRMVFLYARGQAGVYYMFGEGSGADSLIDALGGYDVAHEIGWTGMKPVTDEGLVAAQPDVVLMMTDGLTSVGGVSGLLKKFPALANTPAGTHRRIVDMADSQVLAFGPQTAAVLNALAVAIYAPEAVA